MPIKFLSHYIDENTPLYGGVKDISISAKSNISAGDSANSVYLKFANHTGTHIDFPRHFSENGKTINSYNADFWIFQSVFMIKYQAKIDEIIDVDILKNFKIPSSTEFLIIKTGFQKHRRCKKYWNNNPGLSPNLAYEIKKKCPKIKAVGFDFISLTSFQNRPLGRKAHKAFLVENDILIIEDMKLDAVSETILKVIALPLMINSIDGAPITLIAEDTP